MEDKELKALWQRFDEKLDESLALQRKNAEDISQLKIKSVLASMRPTKIFTIVVGILWVVFVDFLIIASWPYATWFFLISALVQVVLTKLAIGIYLYQLITIEQMDIGGSVLETQEKIANLKASTLWCARLLFLQLPVWTTFFIHPNMLQPGPGLFILVLIIGIFSFTALWLFFNIKYENRDKKWFRFILEGQEWKPVLNAMAMLEEIRKFQKEEIEDEYV